MLVECRDAKSAFYTNDPSAFPRKPDNDDDDVVIQGHGERNPSENITSAINWTGLDARAQNVGGTVPVSSIWPLTS